MLGVQSLGPIIDRRVAEEAQSIPATTLTPRCSRRAAAGDADLERDAWVVLLSVHGLGPVSFGALLAAFGSARTILAAASEPTGPTRLLQALADGTSSTDDDPNVVFDACAVAESQAGTPPGGGGCAPRRRQQIGVDLARRICEAAAGGARTVEQVRALGLTAITLEEPVYPARLRTVELPPPLLFVRGSADALSARRAVAVVGTRWPTDKGRLIAGWIGSAVARAGGIVVSGLAVGIDGAAHAAVVGEGGQTVAVLGGGHARLFPRAHDRLADAIVAAGGAVVSELPPDTSPSRGTFPRRNRLVSGLSDATVVVEAGRRSGALITAGWALEQGRECFLVPGPLDSPASAGCHAFLRSFPGQARIVCGIPELLEDLSLDGTAETVGEGSGDVADDEPGLAAVEPSTIPSRPGAAPSASVRCAGRAAVLASLGPAERALAQELMAGPATADQLALRTSLPGAAVLSALTLLELRGLATGAYGRYLPSGGLAAWPEGVRRRSRQ